MADKQIQVKFPDKLSVTSPKIDAINEAVQHLSNWMHNDFQEMIRPLQVLPQLPGILGDLKEKLVEQFRLQFSGQVAVQMKAREANIRVDERKAHLVQDQIERKGRQSQESNVSTRERFANRAEQLGKEHESYLRQLDSHAYDITDQIYPEQIQSRFSYVSQPFWGVLARHMGESVAARSECLSEGYEEAKRLVEAFASHRQRSYGELSSLTSAGVKEGSYDIPYWFIVVEDIETREKRVEVRFDWEPDGSTKPAEKWTEQLQASLLKGVKESDLGAMPEGDRFEIEANLQAAHGVPIEEIERFRQDCTKMRYE